MDTGCRDDLLEVDGRPVGVRITGAGAGAGELQLEGCDDGAAVELGPASTSCGRRTGARPARPRPAGAALGGDGRHGTGGAGHRPAVTVQGEGRTSFDLRVEGVDGPFWLVLGQSHNLGWEASADGLGDLGTPHVVDGFANGWLVDPGDASTLDVALDWAPQRSVWGGLLLSTVPACSASSLVLVGRRRPVLQPWLGRACSSRSSCRRSPASAPARRHGRSW
jgi:hypothetical protein